MLGGLTRAYSQKLYAERARLRASPDRSRPGNTNGQLSDTSLNRPHLPIRTVLHSPASQ